MAKDRWLDHATARGVACVTLLVVPWISACSSAVPSEPDGERDCSDSQIWADDACRSFCNVDLDCFSDEKCRANVCRAIVCGDRLVELGEECDDGGVAPGDGCDANCLWEPGFCCDPGMVCVPDGANHPLDTCLVCETILNEALWLVAPLPECSNRCPQNACDDDNSCTVDRCGRSDECVNVAVADGTSCPATDCMQGSAACSDGICVGTPLPAGTPCGETAAVCFIQDTCDGAGKCIDRGYSRSMSPCGDPSSTTCDWPDRCDGGGVCSPGFAPPSMPCASPVGCWDTAFCQDGACVAELQPSGWPCGGDPTTDCGSPGVCDAGGNCGPNSQFDGQPCGPDDACAVPGLCSVGMCVGQQFSVAATPCGDATSSDCTLPDDCDGLGQCLSNDVADGTPCQDCGATFCDADGCLDGVCLACDAGPTSRNCVTDADCTGCDPGVACEESHCQRQPNEHFACADVMDLDNWDDNDSCAFAGCFESTVNINASGAVGAQCSGGGWTSDIVYSFYTYAEEAPYNVWMHNVADAETDANEPYVCTLSGTASGEISLDIIEPDATSRYGPGCQGVGSIAEFCWMALDGDADPLNEYQPIVLTPGFHRLQCSVSTDATNELNGFDGIIVTTNLSFVPDEYVSGLLCSDADFTAGECNGPNWGPNDVPPTEGRCTNRDSPIGTACATCPSGSACICNGSGGCVDP